MTIMHHTTYFVYRIVNFRNGKVYVGKTLNVKQRKSDHFKLLRKNKHHSWLLQKAYNKYGEKSFYLEILEKNVFENDIDSREIYWIAYFNSYHNGYNCTLGGSSHSSSGIKCFWNGIEYPTISAAARSLGISKQCMKWRINRGYTCDNDMVGRGVDQSIGCWWEDVWHSSLSECARCNNISIEGLRKWFSKGYTKRDDVPEYRRRVIWNGIIYPTIMQASIETGIPNTSLRRYLKKGHSCTADIH